MNTIVARSTLLLAMSLFVLVTACTSANPTPSPEPTPTPDPTPTPTATPPLLPTPSPSPSPTLEATPTPDADGVIWYEPNRYEPNRATITIEDSTIIFQGDIEDSTDRDFFDAVNGKEDQINSIRINSGGGITYEAMKIGEWIFDHELDVIVDELCFSSCANYIFTAGKNKIIEKDAIVGWHGSEQQDPFIAVAHDISLEELYRRNFDEMKEWGDIHAGETKESFVELMMESYKYGQTDEPAFLEKIGVHLYLLVYGMLPDQFDYYNEQTEFDGWTFSIEDMAKFGVNNVTYKGTGEYPSEKGLENFPVAVFEVPTDTVPPAVIPTPLTAPTPPLASTPTATPDPDSESGFWIDPEPASISVEGDTVTIDGFIDFDAYSRLLNAIRGREDEITTLRVTSDDGFLEEATLIGLWLHDNEIDVIVDEACFSACANYIFTAGKNKIIEESALVGWYGSPQADEYEARALDLSIEEVLRRRVDRGELVISTHGDEPGLDEKIQGLSGFIRNEIRQERRFLKTIGIKEDALIYGYIDVDYQDEGPPARFFEGWTFTIEDMAKLGIENVTYEGNGSYPEREEAFRRGVEIFRVGETLNQLPTR